MASQNPKIDDIFLTALDMDSNAERAAYLDKVCGSDRELKQRVERLLAAQPKVAHFLESPAPGIENSADREPLVTEQIGDMIGPYRILQQIGEGGMGIVFMAQQELPVRRQVALKIMKPGMDSKQVIARFEAERQALALMDHPHIARVLDAGTTESGRPYFAMDLVKGVSITMYCDQNELSPNERLKLFRDVCDAIQHAHQKGIIHRDIKPSNVLIAPYDGKPVVKVIDFGIAKAIGQRLTERTMFTGLGQFLGTAEYMSPEQAELNQLDVDTRSDIYSLGVLLYELLTGSTPLTKDQLREAGLEGMLRSIRETDPPKPSTRISESGQSLAKISKARKSEPNKLSRFLRGDLDWIAMKALEKDRSRRYETASELAADVQRFLEDEPVMAGPPTAVYRFYKFARRNKTLLGAGAAVAAVLVIASLVSSALAYRAIRAERELRQVADAEMKQRKRAETNSQKAIDEATKSAQFATLLQGMLQRVGPSVALGRDTELLKEILDETAERIETELQKQPEVESDMRATLGAVYLDLGDYPAAERMHRKALDMRRTLFPVAHKKKLDSLRDLSESANFQNKTKEADSLLREALALAKELFGDQHQEYGLTLRMMGETKNALGSFDEAEGLLRQALAIQRKTFEGDHEEIAMIFHRIGYTQMNQKQFEKAERSFRQALRMRIRIQGVDHPDVASTYNDIAVALSSLEKHEESITAYRQALEICDRVLGDHHPKTISLQCNLAFELMDCGDEEEGMRLADQAYENSKLVKGKRMEVTPVKMTYAMMLVRQGRHGEAEEVAAESITSLRQEFGPNSPFLFDYVERAGNLFWKTGS